jgi:uncharacterized protein (TIGR02391 family)
MAKKRLDPDLLDKMVKKTGKSKQYLREQVSRRASKSAVSSLAAQLLWARELGLGIAYALNRAGSAVQEEVRSAPAAALPSTNHTSTRQLRAIKRGKEPNPAAAIDFVLQDPQLRDRCRDILLAKKHYDRVVREATTVLDDRIKKISGITGMNPGPLVAKALAPDPSRAVIVVSSEKDEQEGFFFVCKGVMQAFRNKAHHTLSSAFTQAEALKFCGFIDTILAVITKGAVHPDRI